MGLFDSIKCKVALPVPKDRGELANENWLQETFQTKDLFCCLDDYEIRADGTLWRLDKKAKKWNLEKFTGGIRFYNNYHMKANDYWVEFVALIEDGKLIKNVKLESWEQEDNADRRLATKRLDEFIMKQSKNRLRWQYRLFIKPWNRFIRWDCSLNRRVHRWCLRMVDKWERWATIDR